MEMIAMDIALGALLFCGGAFLVIVMLVTVDLRVHSRKTKRLKRESDFKKWASEVVRHQRADDPDIDFSNAFWRERFEEETLDVFRAYEAPIQWVMAMRSREVGLRTTGVMAAFAFAIATENNSPEALGSSPISLMFEKLVSGNDPIRRTSRKSPCKSWSADSPIARLRTFLTSDEAKLITRSLDRGLAELTLQAIYLEQKEKPIKKLEMALDGVNHFRKVQRDLVARIAALFELPGHEKAKKAA